MSELSNDPSRRDALKYIAAAVTAFGGCTVNAEEGFYRSDLYPYSELSNETLRGMHRQSTFDRYEHTCFMLSLIDQKNAINTCKSDFKINDDIDVAISKLQEFYGKAAEYVIKEKVNERYVTGIRGDGKDLVEKFVRAENNAADLINKLINMTPEYRETAVAQAQGKPFDSPERVSDRHYQYFVNLSCHIDLLKEVLSRRTGIK